MRCYFIVLQNTDIAYTTYTTTQPRYKQWTARDQSHYYHQIITISQKCVKIFAPNFVHLFSMKLLLSVLLGAVITSLTIKWRECKLQERTRNWTKQRVGFIEVISWAATTTFVVTRNEQCLVYVQNKLVINNSRKFWYLIPKPQNQRIGKLLCMLSGTIYLMKQSANLFWAFANESRRVSEQKAHISNMSLIKTYAWCVSYEMRRPNRRDKAWRANNTRDVR